MNFNEYSPLAMRTAKPFPKRQQIMHALLGLMTETGELADAVKRHVVYGKPLDRVNIMEEVADCMWYLNLFMVEREIAPGAVDRAAREVFAVPGSMQKAYEKDPFKLVEAVLVASSLLSTLNLDEAERGVSDTEVVYATSLMFCSLLDFSEHNLSDALEKNINKLAARYGDKYSDYNALNRDTAAERAVLEGSDAQPG